MPQASAGNRIASSTQLGVGVVDASAIATDAVEALEIKTGAVGTDEIADGVIVDADIAAGAAIDDAKLAEIDDANKVSGASFKSLSLIPAGAGVIPAANTPTPSQAKYTITASDTLLQSADTARVTGATAVYVVKKSIQILFAGTYRIKFTLRRTGSGVNIMYGRVYKNGSAIGTERTNSSLTGAEFSQDFTFAVDDYVQIYGHNGNTTPSEGDCEISLFRVSASTTTATAPTIVTD